MAGTSYQRCGYGKWLPDPNHMSDGGGDILTGVGSKNAPNPNITRRFTLLCLFLPAPLPYRKGKNDDCDPCNEAVENPRVRLSSVTPQQISQLINDNRPIVQGGMQW